LLRQKANYDVLEGFLTVLLRRHIKIVNIPESEGNPEEADDKINKVDILCENEHKELILLTRFTQNTTSSKSTNLMMYPKTRWMSGFIILKTTGYRKITALWA